MNPPLDAVYTHRFERELAELLPNARRADEFIRGAEWCLSRDPESGTQVVHSTPVWYLPIDEVVGATQVAVYYTFDAERVFFLSIRLA